MATINNSETLRVLIKQGRLETLREKVPNQLAEKIVPVIVSNFNQFSNFFDSSSAINTTSSTIFTIPIDKDFWLTSAFISLIKDVTSTSTATGISATIDETNVSEVILRIPGITLTAQNDSINMTYAHPIKLKSGTSINLTNTTNVANVVAFGGISGILLPRV